MANLTAKQEAFIGLMSESTELAHRGFEMLVKRTDPEVFFDALATAGMFAASSNPAAIPAAQEGHVRIPYWPPLDYLVAVAKVSGQRNDFALAERVMGIVRATSKWRDSEGRPRENYHTSRKFAEILGVVPTAAVTLDDVDLIALWLDDRFERGMVGQALNEGALKRFVQSSQPEDWSKALRILSHCTVIRWRHESGDKTREKQPESAVEDYWLKEMLGQHVSSLGVKLGKDLCALFLNRVREVFNAPGRREYGYIYRPAVEDHSQNHDWHGAENRPVEGLRDALIAWCNSDPEEAKGFLTSLFDDELSIVRRIGISVLSSTWASTSDIFESVLRPKLFDVDHLHELYKLLNEHFGDFSAETKQQTLDLIRSLRPDDESAEAALALKRIQLRWLSAIAGKGNTTADDWFNSLVAAFGSAPEHPDFFTYSEVTVGPGPSPYSVQELHAFLQGGSLVEELNRFEAPDSWTGPSVEALADTVQELVKSAPSRILGELQSFLGAKAPYQNAVISGLREFLENSSNRSEAVDWDRAWVSLLTFFESLVFSDEFWQSDTAAPRPMVATSVWVASSIADVLRGATRKDDLALPSVLLPRSLAIMRQLLRKLAPVTEAADDAMTQAINSPRGKVLEALVSQALYECRNSDRLKNSHAEAWRAYQPVFDEELSNCRGGNFEFSTLVGAYLGQFRFMGAGWVDENMARIFPVEYQGNCICAIGGLAFAAFTRETYRLLAKHRVLERALSYELNGRGARERLVERMAVAYLWKEDELDSSRFECLFRPEAGKDLITATRLFWSIRQKDLPQEQKTRVVAFWKHCILWAQRGGIQPEELLSTLATLTPYLTSADGDERALLEAVAPQVHIGYNAHDFVEDLSQLVDVSPDGVNIVLAKVIAARTPDFDYKDRLKALLERLVKKGKREDVIRYAEQLRNLSGIQEFYERIRRLDSSGE